VLEAPRLREPSLCERCGAVYLRKTWRRGERRRAFEPPVGVHWTVCPACRQVRRGEYFGKVSMRGSFLRAHEEEILRRVRRVAERAASRQPERRIVRIVRTRAGLDILTTSQKLAHRITRELLKAFRGRATYAWSDRGGLLFATWERAAEPRRAAPQAPRP
jgi:NMD protein affecting ribosome stability and mRNA decay